MEGQGGGQAAGELEQARAGNEFRGCGMMLHAGAAICIMPHSKLLYICKWDRKWDRLLTEVQIQKMAL